MADMTSEARVVALDRLWPDSAASRSDDLLDVAFGWTDFTRLRRLVAGRCAAAGLTGSRLDDFVLAVHEISANAIMHAGTDGRLILRSAANGLRCLIEDHAYGPGDHGPPAGPDPGHIPRARDGSGAAGPGRPEPSDPADPDEPHEPHEPAGAETGRGLWLAAQLTDELSITSGPDSTIVSLYMRFE
jgi:anti-sigma regulatory factor (Ser/Thr protein kinase)